MRELVRGWRRKTGLALLAVALLLTVAWFRSLIFTDTIFYTFGDCYWLHSSGGSLSWVRQPMRQKSGPTTWFERETSRHWCPGDITNGQESTSIDWPFESKWDWECRYRMNWGVMEVGYHQPVRHAYDSTAGLVVFFCVAAAAVNVLLSPTAINAHIVIAVIVI